jgi:hypothetical protein
MRERYKKEKKQLGKKEKLKVKWLRLGVEFLQV